MIKIRMYYNYVILKLLILFSIILKYFKVTNNRTCVVITYTFPASFFQIILNEFILYILNDMEFTM